MPFLPHMFFLKKSLYIFREKIEKMQLLDRMKYNLLLMYAMDKFISLQDFYKSLLFGSYFAPLVWKRFINYREVLLNLDLSLLM